MDALSTSLANTLAMDRTVRKAGERGHYTEPIERNQPPTTTITTSHLSHLTLSRLSRLSHPSPPPSAPAEADLEARSRSPATYAALLLKIMRAHTSGSATALDMQAQLTQQSCLMSAAVALKNIVKNRWDDSAAPPADADGAANATTSEDDVTSATAVVGDFGPADCEARAAIRDEILACLLASEKDDLTKTLAEAFRVIVSTDFPARWDTLLPTLRKALEAADDPSADPSASTSGAVDDENPGATAATPAAPAYKLEQVLVAVGTLSKQYVYFRSDAKDPNAVPADLERIAVEVMKPLLKQTLPRLVKLLSVDEADDAAPAEEARTRATECAYMICKAYNRLTKAYLPVVLGGTEAAAASPGAPAGKKGGKKGKGGGNSSAGANGSSSVCELGDQALSSMLDLLRLTLLPAKAANADGDDGAEEDEDEDDGFSRALDLPQWRLAKRVLTAFRHLVERHSKALTVHTSVTDLLTVVWQALAEQRVRMPDVIAALCLDTATQALELPFHRVQVCGGLRSVVASAFEFWPHAQPVAAPPADPLTHSPTAPPPHHPPRSSSARPRTASFVACSSPRSLSLAMTRSCGRMMRMSISIVTSAWSSKVWSRRGCRAARRDATRRASRCWRCSRPSRPTTCRPRQPPRPPRPPPPSRTAHREAAARARRARAAPRRPPPPPRSPRPRAPTRAPRS